MKITKILAPKAAPAKIILDRADHIALTSAQRQDLPKQFVVGEKTLEVAIEEMRPLNVGDVLLDEAGHFYVVAPQEEPVFIIKGDEEVVAEAVVALLNRGIEVAQCENGFAVLQDATLARLLSAVGLEFEEGVLAFDPIRIPEEEEACGCGCGGHHHEHGEGCGCGGHHHHEHGEGCGCGGHHHHHEHGEGCGCGGHEHHHEHGEGCGCGGHEHHHEHGEGCGCGGHGHHHEHGGGCGCGNHEHHHHHHEEGGCCCKDK